MRTSRLPFLLLASALVLPAASQSNSDAEIVVTGRSLKDTADALAGCIARDCRPNQNVAARLGHAENQLLQGEHADSQPALS